MPAGERDRSRRLPALPKAERLRVNRIVAARGDDALQTLRTAIEAALLLALQSGLFQRGLR
ncbi:hypothetical protein BIWAKO_05709 [Bosea sp. BIWAKO-01]|nr:hypothetical protein BIWAKO_05709 [Bosea sp. BIWAKO-01]